MPALKKTANSAAESESLLRGKLIEAASDGWKNRLIDLSRRNNLLFYKPAISGTLELPFTPRLVSFLSDGEPLPIRDLLGSEQVKISSVRTIARKGLENLEEKGLSTLYLALGRSTWTADDGGRDPVAPVLLVPIGIKLKGQDLQAAEIHLAGEVEVNPVLLYVLQRELNLLITPEAILTLLRGNGDTGDEPGSPTNLNAVLVFLNAKACNLPGFRSDPFAVLGNFSFQKLAMVRDLEAHHAQLLANDVIAAIAGDTTARRNLGASQLDTDPGSLDSISPDNEFAVVEADSSQQCAIEGIAAGQSAVVHGPPGTGKSQTITNLIATLTARGHKVLFVAEKRAALEVVMNRLKAVGLDHLAIDLHGAEQTPQKVMERLARTLNTVREAFKPAPEAVHDQFVDRRSKLNRHDAQMHTVHSPTRQTIYAMQGALLRLPSNISSPLRWRGPDLMQITPKRAERVIDLLREAAGFETLFNRSDASPWTGAELKDGQAVQGALDLAARLSGELIPSLRANLQSVCNASGLREPKHMSEIGELLTLLRQAQGINATYAPEIFIEADRLLAAMPAGRLGGVKGVWFRLTDPGYKGAYRRAIQLRNDAKAAWNVVVAELSEAFEIWTRWQNLSGSGAMPKIVLEINSCEPVYQATQAGIRTLESFCKSHLLDLELVDLFAEIAALSSDSDTPYRIRRLYEIEQELYSLGVQRFVDEIRSTRRAAAQWVALFQYVWLKSTIDAAAINEPGILGFVGSTHDEYVEDFKRLDRTRLKLAADRVRRAHAERTIAAMNQFPEQETLIRGEAAKSRRHKPLRKVFAEATEVLTAVCPCWMASPLSVCQLIAATGIFDYVIFDEASQVLPEDAVAAILRGKHVIVAGDNKQLPPSAFFSAAEEEDESDVDATAYESLLDMMIPFVKGFHLNWHYRSRDESLISFSNHHMYDNRLVTFPGPGLSQAISHSYVDYVPGSEGHEDSSAGEVRKVVELVLRHAATTPERTLGVITMGIKHANRIQALLDQEMLQHPQLSGFFDTRRPERFFVKNLERVQGDERDVIILSVGYGKDRAGNLPLRFGPILSVGGRRRLNVAATRAKEQVTVVSSFMYSDINSTQVKAGTGLEFLKNYLQYASTGGKLLSLGEITNEPMNDFEADVFEVLRARGIEIVPQVGCSKFRIDLAACHPAKPGKFVLAIECDGATYHSSYTARDRDRLRQQQLENLGWTFHRIWSTDWFMRRDEEVERAVKAFHKAVAMSDEPRPFRGMMPVPPDENPGSGVESACGPDEDVSRAPIPKRASIAEYTYQELQALLQWVQSDGKLRTHEEIADAMFAALPFSRRGVKIEAALKRAIQTWEKTKSYS